MPSAPTPVFTSDTVKSATVSATEGFVSVSFSDGLTADFHPLHLLHASSSNQLSTLQKIKSIAELPSDPKVSKCEISEDSCRLRLLFQDGDTSDVPSSLLHRYAVAWNSPKCHRQYLNKETAVPRVQFDSLEADEGLYSLLSAIDKWGLAVVEGVPPTDSDAVAKIGKRISGHSPSHAHLYGDLWDVRTSAPGTASNVAYTTERLGLHTDLVYYMAPPGLQLLHCLEFDRSRVEGGASLFLDAFAAAEELRSRSPSAFSTLCKVPASFKKIRRGVSAETFDATMTFHAPHIAVDPRTGETINVRWAPAFEDVPLCTAMEMQDYAKAYRGLFELIEGRGSPEEECERERERKQKDDENNAATVRGGTRREEDGRELNCREWREAHLVRFFLHKGECVVFNNCRVLHGREGFALKSPSTRFDSESPSGLSCGQRQEKEEARDHEAPPRHLRGCYVQLDDALSRFRSLAWKLRGFTETDQVGAGSRWGNGSFVGP